MFTFLMSSIVVEIFACALVFCAHAPRPRWRELWTLPAGLLVCGLASPVLLSLGVGQPAATLLSAVYYILAFLAAALALQRLFGMGAVSALVIATLGYCVQHLGSDLSYVLMPNASATSGNVVLDFYLPHILVILTTALVAYVAVGRSFRIDVTVVSRRVAWIAACMAAVFFVIVFSLVFANDQQGTMRQICFVYDALATTFVMAILILLSRVDALRADIAANEAIWELRGEQYRLTRESIDLINEKCHDIRKRIGELGAPALSVASVERIQESIQVYDAAVRTGNDALDVVLTAKSLLCSQRGIELVCLADGAALGFVPDDELYSLMENVLDNAIEAVMRLSNPEQRSVSLTVRREGGFVSIREDNYFEGDLEIVDGLPRTTKPDRTNHGFGLRSIRRCVEEHGGEMRLRAEDGVFSLAILLPTPEGV